MFGKHGVRELLPGHIPGASRGPGAYGKYDANGDVGHGPSTTWCQLTRRHPDKNIGQSIMRFGITQAILMKKCVLNGGAAGRHSLMNQVRRRMSANHDPAECHLNSQYDDAAEVLQPGVIRPLPPLTYGRMIDMRNNGFRLFCLALGTANMESVVDPINSRPALASINTTLEHLSKNETNEFLRDFGQITVSERIRRREFHYRLRKECKWKKKKDGVMRRRRVYDVVPAGCNKEKFEERETEAKLYYKSFSDHPTYVRELEDSDIRWHKTDYRFRNHWKSQQSTQHRHADYRYKKEGPRAESEPDDKRPRVITMPSCSYVTRVRGATTRALKTAWKATTRSSTARGSGPGRPWRRQEKELSPGSTHILMSAWSS